MKAEKIEKKRHVTEKGNLIITRIWKIPKSRYYPEGIKYSFQFISNNKRILGYDNYNNEGHHKHIYYKKERFDFTGIKDLKERFAKEVEWLENENQTR